jgi:hypothetical protein
VEIKAYKKSSGLRNYFEAISLKTPLQFADKC